jgi:2-oxoglutarate ferredoxin oxidoreductase subunit beta
MSAGAAKAAAKLGKKDFESDQDVRWCPGCGDYSILANLQRLMPELGVPRENVVFVSGIGCSSRFPYYMNTYGFHTIHGRAPSFATGMKLANPALDLWVVTGDGDGLSIGGNHLLHTIRRNVNLQILLFNNRVYGLTKGQYSPTSREGMKTKSTPQGSIDHPVDPIAFALGAGATFVARSIDVHASHLQEVLRRAHAHRGTAFVEILQNCPVYNDGEWIAVEDKATRDRSALMLRQGEPLVFGDEGGPRAGIHIEQGIPSRVEVPKGADPRELGVAVHDEAFETPAYAFALASIAPPAFPTPIGIFRAVEKSTYDDALEAQIHSAVAERGPGDLSALLRSGDTWNVTE